MRLAYKALGPEGKTVKGVVEAKTPSEAASFLRSRKYTPIAIVQEGKGIASLHLSFMKGVGLSDIVFFTRELSSMFTSGLTLIQSLRILREQVQNEEFKTVLTGLIADVEEGKSFADSLEKYPKVFSSIYVSLVRAAESSGLLDKILLRLAENLEKQQKLQSEVKAALMYPVIVIIGMFIVTTVMMIFVIPQLSVLYEGLNVELPLPTKIVIGLSNFTVNFWPLVIGGGVLGVMLYLRWSKTPSGRLIIDNYMLKIPIIGKLIKEKTLTEFTRTFGLLVGSGTLVVSSLRQSAMVVGNVHYQHAVQGIADRVEKGIAIGDAMGTYPLFPPILIQMSKIGEETGKLDESMLKVSDYFEREVEITIKNLSTAMEPIIMVVLGTGVGFLVISIIMPIYNLVSVIQ